MKPIKNLWLGLLFIAFGAQAQVSISVNLSNPPAWGPAGYSEVRYYYLPDIYTYYDVGTREYIYTRNGRWVRATTLPVAYRSYDLYRGYKVVLTDYRGKTPYIYYKTHKAKYPKGYKASARQRTIGLPPGQAKKAVVVNTPGGKKVLVQKPNGDLKEVKKHKKGHPHKRD
ncbi:MAG TPA: hypothetical protein VEA37_00185 [Flavobacterium sp.]|nr:hypothetical protein [Flavobacterium sp.]